MKYHTRGQITILAVFTLGIGAVACAQEPSARSAVVEAEAPLAQAAVSSADADGTRQQPEPSVADWKAELQIKMMLLERLGSDSLKVEVTCREGAVTLSGMVARPETQELAETIAEAIPSVTGVRNLIHLETGPDLPEPNSAVDEVEAELHDAMLTTKVRLALVEVLGADGFRVDSEVAHGRVTLGFSPDLSPARRAEALKAVRDIDGVTEVVLVDRA